MNELERIQDQIVRSLDGGAWHGPALMEVLSGLDARTAAARPIADTHTIWEILRHVSATAKEVLARLRGETRVLSPEQDWPAPPPAGGADARDERFASSWEVDIRHLDQVHRELIEELAALDESRLDTPILPGYSTIYVTLHGLVQHNLYHAGQMAILKKAAKIDVRIRERRQNLGYRQAKEAGFCGKNPASLLSHETHS